MKVKITIVTVFIYGPWVPFHVFCLWFVYGLSQRIISLEKAQLFGKSWWHSSFLRVSWSLSVCDSEWSLIITGEQRSPTEWIRPLWFSCVPAMGLRSSDGIPANKETCLSICRRRMWAKKCAFIFFFFLVWNVHFKRNERHTRSCSDYKVTKRETGAESVSVPAT